MSKHTDAIAIFILFLIMSMPLAVAGNLYIRHKAHAARVRHASDWPVRDKDCSKGWSATGGCL